MRRASVAAVGTIGLLTVGGISAYAGATPKGSTKRALTLTVISAQISAKGLSFERVSKDVGPLDGTCAGISDGTVSGTAFPLNAKDTVTRYCANGVSKLSNTYALSKLNASGISTVTGSGKCSGGTGVHKHEKCTYTFTGTYNSKTTISNGKVTGTDTR